MKHLLIQPQTVRPVTEEDQVIWQEMTQEDIDKTFTLKATKTLADGVLVEVFYDDGKPEPTAEELAEKEEKSLKEQLKKLHDKLDGMLDKDTKSKKELGEKLDKAGDKLDMRAKDEESK